MKINVEKGVGVKSNSESSKKIKMKINADMGMALVTRYLYSNPIQTLTQEYLCNGRDAIRAAKKQDPIHVTLPTRMDPTLKIRDFGNGISDDSMENVFCVLGESEKRKSDELTGGFGIGAKSGWAYTDSFMIRSIVNGESSLYLAHMGESQSGTLELISKSPTKEEDGVEIQINVKENDIASFHKAVYRATQFWQEKPVIKGVLPEEIPSFWKNAKPLFQDENWAIFKTSDLPENIVDRNVNTANIIMAIDRIPYRLGNVFNEFDAVKAIKGSPDSWRTQEKALLRSDVTLVVFLNNNDVEVAANREELNSNEYSKKQVDKILTELAKNIKSYQSKQESLVKSVPELVQLQKTERAGFNSINGKSFEKNGIKYTLDEGCRLTITCDKFDTPLIFEQYAMSKNRSGKLVLSCNDLHSINFSSHANTTVIYKDTADGSGLTREKVRSLFETELVNGKAKWGEQQFYTLSRATPSVEENEKLEILKEELGFQLLSSVKLPEKIRAKSSRPSSKGKVVIHHLTIVNAQYRGNSFEEVTVYLDDAKLKEDKWLYIETIEGKRLFPKTAKKTGNDNWSLSNSTIASLVPFFLARGWKICTATTKQVLKIKDLTNFKSFDDFIVNAEKYITLSKEEKAIIQARVWRNLPSWISLFKSDLSVIKDKDVHQLVQYEKQYTLPPQEPNQMRASLPHFVENTLLVNQIKELQGEVSTKFALVQKIEARYPLASNCRSEYQNDILLYVNSKYKEINKKRD